MPDGITNNSKSKPFLFKKRATTTKKMMQEYTFASAMEIMPVLYQQKRNEK